MRHIIAIFPALVLASLAACAPRSGQLPAGVRVFGGASVARMLHQCSRSTPAPGEGSWTPQAQDIIALEKLLPDALKAKQPTMDWSRFPDQWARQYVGIVRGGRRFLYGNFVPRHGDGPSGDKVSIICDGGPSFFGAEYDVTMGAITHLAFNGPF